MVKVRLIGSYSPSKSSSKGSVAFNLIAQYSFLENAYFQAVKEINQIVMTKKVNYVVDADIKGFFDNVDHKWLMRFLEHDIQDKNFLRYIYRFLKLGIVEELKYYESDKGTPQGGLILPILANVYLH